MGQYRGLGTVGEVCQEYLKKCSLVYLEGRLKTDKYEDNGESRFYSKVVATELEFLDKKPTNEPMMITEENVSEYEYVKNYTLK